jgi:hypothetical protein
MGKEEVNMVQTHLLQAKIQAQFNIFGCCKVRPEFGSDNNVRSWNARFTDRSSNFLVNAVYPGAVKVTIASFKGCQSSIFAPSSANRKVERLVLEI